MNYNFAMALEVHGELSRLIRPATPQSIRASDIWSNRILKGIIFAGAISFLIFIIPALIDLKEDRSNLLQIIGVAGLGVTFHSLYTANGYIKNSTFDPKYGQGYIINFSLGLFASSILGLFWSRANAFRARVFESPPKYVSTVRRVLSRSSRSDIAKGS